MAMRLKHKIAALCIIIGLMTAGGSPPAVAAKMKFERAANLATWFTWPRYDASDKDGILWPAYTESFPPPTDDQLRALKRAGFDSVRLPVDPAPFFVFKGTKREAVYERLERAIKKIRSAGLKVIVDMHPNSRHEKWGQYAIAAGTQTPVFRKYAQTVSEFARRLKQFGNENVALELLNEPRVDCDNEAGRQQLHTIMRELIKSARSSAPEMSLVVSGGCVSSIEGLISLNPKALEDGNLIYTFHFYEPFAFTHQGAKFVPWSERYLTDLPWPASIGKITSARTKSLQTVANDDDLGPVSKLKKQAEVSYAVQKYFAANYNPKTLDARFKQVARWAKNHKIAPRSIFLGEFGVMKTAPCADRYTWTRSAVESAERYGFAWAAFNLHGPFSLLESDHSPKLDMAMLEALGMESASPNALAKACE